MSEIKTNQISSLTGSNSDITLDPDGTGDVIVASGNVGVGTASPATPLTVQSDSDTLSLRLLGRSSDDRSDLEFYENDGTTKIGAISTETDNVGIIASGADGVLSMTANTSRFRNASGTESMRIDNSGRVLINRTSPSGVNPHSKLHVLADSAVSAVTIQIGNNGFAGFSFLNETGSDVGSIIIGASSTAYNTSSDHRLKEAVVDMTGAIDRVKALAPKRFNFIADADTTVDGFLAHEAQTVVPEAVTGTHNQVETWTQQEIDDGDAPDGASVGDNKLDGDGNTIPVMQGIDQSKLVPLLTGALREAIAKIETLEARVTALENA